MGDRAFPLGTGDSASSQPGSAPAGASPDGGLTADVLRIAFQEAMQARLESFVAGERLYDELVRAAENRCDEMLAEARAEGDRIIANARAEAERTMAEALRLSKGLHDEAVRQTWETNLALAEMRSQRSTRIHRLWTRLTGGAGNGDLPEELGAAAIAFPSFSQPAAVPESPAPSTETPVSDVAPAAGLAPSQPPVAAPLGRQQEVLGMGEAETASSSSSFPESSDSKTESTSDSQLMEAKASGNGTWTLPDWLK